jgi:hypothetical protein
MIFPAMIFPAMIFPAMIFPARASVWLRDGEQFSTLLINAAPKNLFFSGRRFAILCKPP